MSEIEERAKDLGNALARTDEYQALQRAVAAIGDDREVTELRNRLAELEEEVASSLRRGREPDADVREEYERVAGDLQSKPGYQRLVAAQSNFDKVLAGVNARISDALKEGGESRIVIPS